MVRKRKLITGAATVVLTFLSTCLASPSYYQQFDSNALESSSYSEEELSYFTSSSSASTSTSYLVHVEDEDEERLLRDLARIHDDELDTSNGDNIDGGTYEYSSYRPKMPSSVSLCNKQKKPTKKKPQPSSKRKRSKLSLPKQATIPPKPVVLENAVTNKRSSYSEKKTTLSHMRTPCSPSATGNDTTISTRTGRSKTHTETSSLSPATTSPATTKKEVKRRPSRGQNIKAIASAPSSTPWIRNFLSARTKDVILPVPKEYIADAFNLAQLAAVVERIGFQSLGDDAVAIASAMTDLPPPQPSFPMYRLAVRLILNEDEDKEQLILNHPHIPAHAIQEAAEALYLMVHARFVASPRGLEALRRLVASSTVFGTCPRVSCDSTPVLPFGKSLDYSMTSTHPCQRYCPKCGNVYHFPESNTDGCGWGPSLCHLLLLTHGNELYSATIREGGRSQNSSSSSGTTVDGDDDDHQHEPNNLPLGRPSVMGFRIHPSTTWGRPLASGPSKN